MLAGRPKSPGCHVHVVTLKESVPSAICLQAGGKKKSMSKDLEEILWEGS